MNDQPDAPARELARQIVEKLDKAWATGESSQPFHAQCHDAVCNGDPNAPRGAKGVSCSCRGRDTAYAELAELRASSLSVERVRALIATWRGGAKLVRERVAGKTDGVSIIAVDHASTYEYCADELDAALSAPAVAPQEHQK